jgi:ATP-dependent Lhr-like helicase
MSTFARFPVELQSAIVSRVGWTSLRPVQELAGAAILDGRNTVVLAPTAGGKTEAAVFPVLAGLMARRPASVGAIYVAPLKALLNNQEERLARYAEMVGLRSFVWHGDTRPREKKRFVAEPADLLMTTPESLEVMLISPRVPAAELFGDLRVVIIDEVHALAGTDRGAHLLSVIERLARFTANDIQRVGLSATVGNPEAIVTWLRGSSRRDGVVVDPPKVPLRREILVLLRGSVPEIAADAALMAAGKKSFFFCQSRAMTEEVAERMRGSGTDVFVHHSSVSAEERHLAEERFHHGSNACIVCTSTLELGIDVGDLDLVFQANAPPTVSSFFQRMGRTGRRPGQAANTRFLCDDPGAVIQAIALIELARERYVEPVATPSRCWPVLVHQLFALALQHSAISAEACWEQLSRVPDFGGITRAEFNALVEHLVAEDYLFRADGQLSLGQRAERIFGRKNFMELYAVFSSPVLYRVHTATGQPLGSIEQDFVDRLVEDTTSFLLGGRAWMVEHVNHGDRAVRVRPAPGGRKPSWGGFTPQLLGLDLCQRMRRVLTETAEYPYLHPSAVAALSERREELADLLRRAARPVQVEAGVACWWTFAGGKINYTLKYGLEVSEGWKVVADNFLLRIEGAGIGHQSVGRAIERMSTSAFWKAPETRRAILGRLPGYRLSKFQGCLPEELALEVIEHYLLDVEETVRWLGEARSTRAARPLVQLHRMGDVPPHLEPGLQGRWDALPERPSVRELEVIAHLVNGYTIGEELLGRECFDLARELGCAYEATGRWSGNAVELLASLFAVVRGWRGLYNGPEDGDENHREALAVYEAVRERLREHPEEVELVPAVQETGAPGDGGTTADEGQRSSAAHVTGHRVGRG